MSELIYFPVKLTDKQAEELLQKFPGVTIDESNGWKEPAVPQEQFREVMLFIFPDLAKQ